jgi:tungstate transport system ATP-binding protein
MTHSVYRIQGLRHQRAGRTVLTVPELIINGPGSVAVVGDNGAGKTTLLRLLSGSLETPSNGVVQCLVDRRMVVLVDQDPYLFATTVAGNVGYPLKVRRVPRRERGERIATALKAVGLGGFERRVARTLSGGERRRVALARAIVLNPKVLLLDEPDAGLDGDAVAALEWLIQALSKDCLVVFSSHDRARAARLADRVIRLGDGRLIGGLAPFEDGVSPTPVPPSGVPIVPR